MRMWNEIDLLEKGDIDTIALPSVQRFESTAEDETFFYEIETLF